MQLREAGASDGAWTCCCAEEMNIEFTFITRDNLRSCAELFVSVFNGDPWNENWEIEPVVKRLNECYNTPGFFGVLARNSEIIGFAFGCVETWDRSNHFSLREICVKRDSQRIGLGSELMKHLEEELMNQEVEKIYLLTARDGSAESFYKKNGFYVSPKMIMMGKYLIPPVTEGQPVEEGNAI